MKASKANMDLKNQSDLHSSPKSPGLTSMGSAYHSNMQLYNAYEVNKCLSKMDAEEVRRRRTEYNLVFKVRDLLLYKNGPFTDPKFRKSYGQKHQKVFLLQVF